MPENNPTPWPPEPEAGKLAAIKQPVKSTAGRISLGLAAGGWLYFVLFLIGIFGDSAPRLNIAGFDILHFLAPTATVAIPILLALFVSGLVAGIIGRRSRTGKIGIALALAFAVILAVGFLWLIVSLDHNPDMFG